MPYYLLDHPNFTQSISFIFLNQIINQPVTSKEQIFSNVFQSKLQANKMYNLNQRADLNELYIAFIHAGKAIDPLFIEKLKHLHHNGLVLNNSILTILSMLAKDGIN